MRVGMAMVAWHSPRALCNFFATKCLVVANFVSSCCTAHNILTAVASGIELTYNWQHTSLRWTPNAPHGLFLVCILLSLSELSPQKHRLLLSQLLQWVLVQHWLNSGYGDGGYIVNNLWGHWWPLQNFSPAIPWRISVSLQIKKRNECIFCLLINISDQSWIPFSLYFFPICINGLELEAAMVFLVHRDCALIFGCCKSQKLWSRKSLEYFS